jgi:hypothetical protein
MLRWQVLALTHSQSLAYSLHPARDSSQPQKSLCILMAPCHQPHPPESFVWRLDFEAAGIFQGSAMGQAETSRLALPSQPRFEVISYLSGVRGYSSSSAAVPNGLTALYRIYLCHTSAPGHSNFSVDKYYTEVPQKNGIPAGCVNIRQCPAVMPCEATVKRKESILGHHLYVIVVCCCVLSFVNSFLPLV